VSTPLQLGGAFPALISMLVAAISAAAVVLRLRHDRLLARFDDAQVMLQCVLDNMIEGFVVLDRERNIVLMNSVGSNLVADTTSRHQPSYSLVEERFEAFTPDGTPLPHEQWPSARALRGDFVQNFPIRYRNRVTGQVGARILRTAPVAGPRGEAGQVILCYRDDTARHHLERQLQQAQKMEAIGQLTGGIAHDFNNLLGVVSGNLDLLEDLIADNEPALQRNRSARKAAQRAADLTRRLLAFSSQEVLHPVATLLEHSVRNALEIAIHALGPSISILIDIAPGMPSVFIDRSGLESALLNLFVNARDAMPEGGTLRVTTRTIVVDETHPYARGKVLTCGTYAQVSVSDSGHGMDKQTLARVFEPFFTTKERGRGTGLGLPMVYGFARQSKGHVQLYSEPGHGTTVSLYVPCAGGNGETLQAKNVPLKRSHTGGKVLLVDDEIELLDIAATYLSKLGYEVFQARDAAQALTRIAEQPGIDVLVTDIVMPGPLNGIELAEAVLGRNPAVHTLFTSGFPADALAEKNFSVGDRILLNKPYRLSELSDAVLLSLSRETPASA
jgi:signal transduction histidine kinase/ActR/RegA family two-component response regulator